MRKGMHTHADWSDTDRCSFQPCLSAKLLENTTGSPANVICAQQRQRCLPYSPTKGLILARPSRPQPSSGSPAQSWVASFQQIHCNPTLQLSELILSSLTTPQLLPSSRGLSWNLWGRREPMSGHEGPSGDGGGAHPDAHPSPQRSTALVQVGAVQPGPALPAEGIERPIQK